MLPAMPKVSILAAGTVARRAQARAVRQFQRNDGVPGDDRTG